MSIGKKTGILRKHLSKSKAEIDKPIPKKYNTSVIMNDLITRLYTFYEGAIS